MVKLFKNALLRFKFLFPHPLPIFEEEFEAWMAKIFKVYGLPDEASYRQAVATAVMHVDAHTSKKAPAHFANSVKKAMASQLAYNVLLKLRDEEKKAKENLEAKQSQAEISFASDAKEQK